MTTEKIFKSFMMGGFESACHINAQGRRIDMIGQTQHDIQAEADYALVKSEGVRTIRDGVRWPLIEKTPGVYDFSSLEPLARAAQKQGIQVVWTLLHYGWPDDIDIFNPEFITRFSAFAKAVAAYLAPYTDGVPFYTPINEMSYLCWWAGEVGTVHPYAKERGHELKKQLVRAALAGMDAIWAIDPQARFVHVEPLINVVAPHGQPDMVAAARTHHEAQFEVCDMLSGRLCPELGGAPKYLDIVGCNFYYENQWFYFGEYIYWSQHEQNLDWVPLHVLLANVHARYNRPIILSETSHFGVNRPAWMRMIIDEIRQVLACDTPFLGICLYPIIDRPDWENADHWHNSGMWDYQLAENGRHMRVLASDYATEIRRAVRLFSAND